MSYEFDAPPEVATWGLDWIGWISSWWKRVKGPIDLTDAERDYKLAVGECARIYITAASTLLHIAVEDGVYEISGLFDSASFGADHDIVLQANNTTYASEFVRARIIGDTSIATDEVDFAESDDDSYVFGVATRLRTFRTTLTIDGLFSSAITHSYGLTAGNRRVTSIWVWRSGTVEHTSLGTFLIGEAATGVLYIRRTA